MRIARSAAVLASATILGVTPELALAAPPKLSARPEGTLPGKHVTASPAGAQAPASGALPSTGSDLALEVFSGAALLTAGLLVRRRATRG